MPVHIPVTDRSDNGRVAVNGKINCSHDNYTIETDEEVNHPDDPRGNREVKFAVCEECGTQGQILSDGRTVSWET